MQATLIFQFRGSFGDWNNKSLHYIVEPLSLSNNSVSEIFCLPGFILAMCVCNVCAYICMCVLVMLGNISK